MLLLFVISMIFFIMLLTYFNKPQISFINLIAASYGDNIEINGKNFGNGEEGSRLIIDSQYVSSTNIVSWNDEKIVVRMPRIDGAVLIKVKTHSRISNGAALGDASSFPSIKYGPWLPGAAYVEYMEPLEGSTGTKVIIRGEGFGNRRGVGKIWVNRADASGFYSRDEPDINLYTEVESIEIWTDSEIRFWIPVNVNSGNIYISRGSQFSNPVHFEINGRPGEFQFANETLWSIKQDFGIKNIGAMPGNSLYLRIPHPVVGTGQRASVIMSDVDHAGYNYVYSEYNLDIYRFDELVSGENRSASRHIALKTSAVTTQIESDNIKPYDPDNPEIAAALVGDQWIRPDLVGGYVQAATGNWRNDWLKANAIYDYVIARLDYTPNLQNLPINEYLVSRKANSQGYSFVFCSLARAAKIPARPVGGIYVDEDGKSQGWWWAEFWIQGLGWVPVDPALADISGESILKFGSLDERHIAFSRGIEQSHPLQPSTVYRMPYKAYTLQGIWEEVSGNLFSYVSDWPIPQVLVFYR